MSQVNEPKLRNKSLRTMCQLLKLAKHGDPAASFLRTIAPVWNQGRQVLYDLFTNTDMWNEAVFSSKILYYNPRVLEVRLKVNIIPDQYTRFKQLTLGWQDNNTTAMIVENDIMRKHKVCSEKRFITTLSSRNHALKNLTTLSYDMWWYVKK